MTQDPPPEETRAMTVVEPFSRTKGEPSVEDILPTLNQQMPYSDEAEKSVLSAWIQAPHLMEEHGLTPLAFYHEANRIMATVLIGRHNARQPIDYQLFITSLRTQGLLDKVGGVSAAMEVSTYLSGCLNFAAYREIVAQKHQQRLFIAALASGIQKLQRFGLDPEESFPDAIGQIRAAIADVEADTGSPELPFRPITQIMDAVINKAEYRANNPGVLPGISTGFVRLDELTGGMQPGRFWTVLAESSEGKSSLCRQLVEAACEAGHSGVIYTY